MPNQALHIVGGLADDDGTSPGMKVIQGDGFPIDIDADGVYPSQLETRVVIDLSHMLSYRLGKQIPQTATFRVNYLRLSPRNVDDANDNDDSQYFAGTWEWYHPTKHRIDALQAWRMLEKRLEEDDADAEGLFVSSEDRYKGFRFGFLSSTDVSYPSQGAPGELPGGYAIVPMIQTYHAGLTNGGVPTQTNALWDRKVGRSSRMGWSTSVSNEDDVGKNAFIQDYEWTAPSGHNIEVMGGLLVLNIEHSSTDTSNAVDDDFNFQIDIGISGWSSW